MSAAICYDTTPRGAERANDLLSAASASSRARLQMLGKAARFHAGQSLFDDDEPADALFEITAGVIKLYKLLADGRCQVIDFLYPGELLGLSVGERYAYTAEAVGPAAARRYARKPFEAIVADDPALARRLMGRVSDELRAAQDHLLLLGRKSAGERVASFLLALAGRSEDDESLDIPMTRSDIADYLGLTTETVSRTFSQLKAQGIISILSMRRAAIRRRDVLHHAAQGEVALEGPMRPRTSAAQRAAWPV